MGSPFVRFKPSNVLTRHFSADRDGRWLKFHGEFFGRSHVQILCPDCQSRSQIATFFPSDVPVMNMPPAVALERSIFMTQNGELSIDVYYGRCQCGARIWNDCNWTLRPLPVKPGAISAADIPGVP